MEIDHFPFVDYIINCKPNVAPPSYLKKKSEYNFIEVFDGGKLQFPILQVIDIYFTIDIIFFALEMAKK